MQQQTIRDRLWLWAMKTNILQDLGKRRGLGRVDTDRRGGHRQNRNHEHNDVRSSSADD